MTELHTVTARLLLAPGIVVAIAIMVKGYAGVGDGFSAGVVVVLAVALQYIALGTDTAERTMPVLRAAPAVTGAGLLLALTAGFLPLAFGEPPFSHQPPPGHEPAVLGTLELTTALAFDIGVFLLVTGGLITLLHHLARGDTTDEGMGMPIDRSGDA